MRDINNGENLLEEKKQTNIFIDVEMSDWKRKRQNLKYCGLPICSQSTYAYPRNKKKIFAGYKNRT